MSFKVNKYSNFVVDKINELPEKEENTAWYMKVHPDCSSLTHFE
jgi:hypothetical protein